MDNKGGAFVECHIRYVCKLGHYFCYINCCNWHTCIFSLYCQSIIIKSYIKKTLADKVEELEMRVKELEKKNK